jgi:hypothetical protein
MLTDLLARTPDLRTMAPADAALTAALRLWVTMMKADYCPLRAVGSRLGGQRAAMHLHLLLEEVGAAWPEPFCVAPHCCPRLSHDEALVVEMVALAVGGDRPGFDRLLAEMLPDDMRDRLFLSATVLGRLLAA